jgi:hypothetical protein
MDRRRRSRRYFQLHVLLGRHASKPTRKLTLRVLDGLAARPR